MIVMAKNKSDQKRRIENVLSALKHDKLAIASLVFLVIIIALALLANPALGPEYHRCAQYVSAAFTGALVWYR